MKNGGNILVVELSVGQPEASVNDDADDDGNVIWNYSRKSEAITEKLCTYCLLLYYRL